MSSCGTSQHSILDEATSEDDAETIKSDKEPGEDCIPPEIYNLLDQALVIIYTNMFNKVHVIQSFLFRWAQLMAYSMSNRYEGNINVPSNYGGITL